MKFVPGTIKIFHCEVEVMRRRYVKGLGPCRADEATMLNMYMFSLSQPPDECRPLTLIGRTYAG